ncbi:unnamed protein product, partial [Boreogadus saida]
ATFTDIQDWAQLVNLQLSSKSQYHAIQSKYLIPAVNDAYKAQQDNNIEHVRELSASRQKVDLGGDASAKFSTYSFQDDATKTILHFELVQRPPALLPWRQLDFKEAWTIFFQWLLVDVGCWYHNH